MSGETRLGRRPSRAPRPACRMRVAGRGGGEPRAATSGAAPRLTKLLVGLSSQMAVFAAALYYFGWARAQATFQYFGLDTSLGDFSTTDYILRSVSLIFTPLVPVLLLTLGATFVHTLLITPLLASRPNARAIAGWLVRALRPACLVVLVAVVVSLALQWSGAADLGVVLPLTMAGAAAGYAYCEHLDKAHQLSERTAHGQDNQRSAVVRCGALLGLFTAGMFWAVGLYAAHVGWTVAAGFERGQRGGSEVVLYSTEGIGITGRGVVATAQNPAVSKFHMRYSGLRLLFKTPERYLLLPENWRRGQDPVIVVADSDDVRVDLTPIGAASAPPT